MSRRLRLLWAFSTFAVGGPQRRFATLVQALGPGYEHAVFAMDGCYDAEALTPSGAPVRRSPGRIVKGGLVSRANLATIRRLLATERPDLLLTTNWGCFEWLLANRGRGAVPQIHFEDGFGPDERPGAQNPKRVWARRLAFRKRGLAFVAPSRVLARCFTQIWRAPADRVHLIPNGVACARFACPPRPSRAPVIGTVAALRPEKRLDRLVEAFARADAPDAALLIVGEGPERAALEAQAAPLKGRVRFVGAQEDVAPFLAQMDVYALTSDTEQMPISLVEAMAAGLPAVATDVGDVRDMLAPENRAHVHPAEDVAGLARSLAALCEDGAARAALGAANARRAEAEYGLAAMTARYDALFRDMIRGA